MEMNTPCFDKIPPGSRLVCICGTDPAKPWETKNWCGKQLMRFPKSPTSEEIYLSEYKERLVRRIKHVCANLPALEHALLDIIFRA